MRCALYPNDNRAADELENQSGKYALRKPSAAVRAGGVGEEVHARGGIRRSAKRRNQDNGTYNMTYV